MGNRYSPDLGERVIAGVETGTGAYVVGDLPVTGFTAERKKFADPDVTLSRHPAHAIARGPPPSAEPSGWGRLAAMFALAMAVSLPARANAQSPNPIRLPTPIIYSIEPSSGAAGSKLTVVGFGFLRSNTVHFDEQSIPDVPVASSAGITCVQGYSNCRPGVRQTLIITVPVVATAGPHDVSVETAKGISNVMTFNLLATRP